MYNGVSGSLIGGQLKKDVSVVFSEDKATISYALWEVALPMAWVKSHPVIDDLLHRKIARAEALAHPVAEPLVSLLNAQGCFTSQSKPRYSLREVKALFDPLRSEWYAAYYAHPAWQRLRHGQASRNGLLAWLIHNYHISRAAGIVAARMAALGKHPDWSTFFRQDALEEYWHCDAYYSLDTPLLHDAGPEEIKAYLPLPSSLAFEEHTLQVAESDPLGHVLIAYFQESSIAFESDSDDFYQTVEQHYQVQGLFTPWKQHIQIDVEQEHADGLGQLLASDAEVDAAQLEQALSHAWLAFYFLRSGLDDILQQDDAGRLQLRQPPVPDAGQDTMLGCLGRQVQAVDISPRLSATDMAHLHHGLQASAFRALGFARGHDQLIACGRYAQKLSRRLPAMDKTPAPGPWCVALVNHMQEAAHCPSTWLMLASLLAERVQNFKLGGEWGAALERELGRTPAVRRAPAALLQLDELIARCAANHDRVPASLLNV